MNTSGDECEYENGTGTDVEAETAYDDDVKEGNKQGPAGASNSTTLGKKLHHNKKFSVKDKKTKMTTDRLCLLTFPSWPHLSGPNIIE